MLNHQKMLNHQPKSNRQSQSLLKRKLRLLHMSKHPLHKKIMSLTKKKRNQENLRKKPKSLLRQLNLKLLHKLPQTQIWFQVWCLVWWCQEWCPKWCPKWCLRLICQICLLISKMPTISRLFWCSSNNLPTNSKWWCSTTCGLNNKPSQADNLIMLPWCRWCSASQVNKLHNCLSRMAVNE